MANFCERLKEERNRLGLKQSEFSAIAGVGSVAQSRYETGDRFPDSKYLIAIAEAGADVLYIITGRRDLFTSDELELLTLFRASSFEKKIKAFQALKEDVPKAAIQKIAGSGHNITNTGNINIKK